MPPLFEDDPAKNDKLWALLLDEIEAKRCAPFLGAGACDPDLPSGATLAKELADEQGYPFEDKWNLPRVAQHSAWIKSPLAVKRWILNRLGPVRAPALRHDGEKDNEPHGVLAELPLPLYLTTNYDDFMFQALQKRDKAPIRDLCHWNENLRTAPTVLGGKGFHLHPATPVVYHFHGYSKPESLVLTEDDYVWFLAQMIKRRDLLPDAISSALRNWSLLFIGYAMGDWNLRVWLRLLRTEFLTYSYMVLLPPQGTTESQARDYLRQNYGEQHIKVCFASAREFCGELRQRWRARRNAE